MCAARTGQLLNLSALASDCGISHSTARSWLTVLQASYVVLLLQPYHQNFGKRLVKMPKLYFLDTGLLCHLLRIDSKAGCKLVEQAGGVIVACAFLVELGFLNGRDKLAGHDVFSLLTY